MLREPARTWPVPKRWAPRQLVRHRGGFDFVLRREFPRQRAAKKLREYKRDPEQRLTLPRGVMADRRAGAWQIGGGGHRYPVRLWLSPGTDPRAPLHCRMREAARRA